jgi:hypothetical protein
MDKELEKTLADINERLRNPDSVPLKNLREWMNSPWLEVQTTAFHLLFEHSHRLEQLPALNEISDFFLRYLERGLRGNSHGEPKGRYVTGHSLRAWFQRLWRQEPRPEQTLCAIRDLLARLVRLRDDAINDAIITAILEHLFQNQSIVDFFSSWRQDPDLAPAFVEALDLSSSGKADSHDRRP